MIYFIWIISYTRLFLILSEEGDLLRMTPVNILILTKSRFTSAGFINLLQELSISGVECQIIQYDSPNITYAHQRIIRDELIVIGHEEFIPRLWNTSHLDPQQNDNGYNALFNRWLSFVRDM